VDFVRGEVRIFVNLRETFSLLSVLAAGSVGDSLTNFCEDRMNQPFN